MRNALLPWYNLYRDGDSIFYSACLLAAFTVFLFFFFAWHYDARVVSSIMFSCMPANRDSLAKRDIGIILMSYELLHGRCLSKFC